MFFLSHKVSAVSMPGSSSLFSLRLLMLLALLFVMVPGASADDSTQVAKQDTDIFRLAATMGVNKIVQAAGAAFLGVMFSEFSGIVVDTLDDAIGVVARGYQGMMEYRVAAGSMPDYDLFAVVDKDGVSVEGDLMATAGKLRPGMFHRDLTVIDLTADVHLTRCRTLFQNSSCVILDTRDADGEPVRELVILNLEQVIPLIHEVTGRLVAPQDVVGEVQKLLDHSMFIRHYITGRIAGVTASESIMYAASRVLKFSDKKDFLNTLLPMLEGTQVTLNEVKNGVFVALTEAMQPDLFSSDPQIHRIQTLLMQGTSRDIPDSALANFIIGANQQDSLGGGSRVTRNSEYSGHGNDLFRRVHFTIRARDISKLMAYLVDMGRQLKFRLL